jgi:uncharacterized protein
MEVPTKYQRYILDSLYGIIHLPDYIWDVLFIPEMQRLRELRLYNINSLCFTGGANINRYEHSIGTCYLALKCIESNLQDLPQKQQQLFVLAALFHDLYNAAFGHSLEYVENFSPEHLFFSAATGKKYEKYEYKHASFEPIYFGMCQEVTLKLVNHLKYTEDDIRMIGEYICGTGEYGVLLSGSIDLDNIDNVYRMSYHMGLTKDKQTPLILAQSIWAMNNKLFIKDQSLDLVKEWINLRNKLYSFLILNADDFSAKYMLTEAIELSKSKSKPQFAWYDTDFQLLEKLANTSSDVANIISRLMKGNVYGCIVIYSTTNTSVHYSLSKYTTRTIIENDLNALFKPEVIKYISDFDHDEQKSIKGIKGISYDTSSSHLKITQDFKDDSMLLLVKKELTKHKSIITYMFKELQNKISTLKLKSPIFGIYSILDINKTNRKVFLNLRSGEPIELGQSSNCLYIAVFIKNIEFSNVSLNHVKFSYSKYFSHVKSTIRTYITSICNDSNLSEIPLYSEVDCV